MSVTTIYHTSNKYNEDSGNGDGNCNLKKTCNMCSGLFLMSRGCNLEKTCPACRILGIHKNTPSKFILKHNYIYIEDNYEFIECEQMLKDEASYKIDTFLMLLRDRERHIIKQIYYNEYTHTEVGKELGITRSRVEQILTKSISTLKHPKNGRELRDYLYR